MSNRGWLVRILALATVLAAAVGPGGAAASHRPLVLEALTSRDGLPQGTVLTTLQDSQGFVWIGTEDGLVRYDGHEVHRYSYDPEDPNGLPGNFVHALAEDAAGDVWMAIKGGGVACWHRRSDRFTSYKHNPRDSTSLGSDAVRTVMVDRMGTVWVGTLDAGLDELTPATGRFRHLRHDPARGESLVADQVQSLYQDHAGAIWVGTRGGLDQMQPDHQSFVHLHLEGASTGESSHAVSQVLEDADHTFWIGTFESGLLHITAGGQVIKQWRHAANGAPSLANDDIRAILDDNAGHLWVGTPDGLDLLERGSGRLSHYGHERSDPQSLGDSFIMSLHQDRTGLVWIGTRAAGVYRWNPHSWELGASRPEWLDDKLVTAFADAPEGRVWVASLGGGLVQFDTVTGQATDIDTLLHQPDVLNERRVMALRGDRAGALWIGTMTSGLKKLAAGLVTTIPVRPGDNHALSAAGIMTIFEARDGRLWIGTHGGGANVLDPRSGEVRQLPFGEDKPGAVSGENVTAFAEDPQGNIWIGTDSGGLDVARADGSIVRVFKHDPKTPASLSANTIYALAVDADGRIWIGTDGGGLDLVEGSSRGPESLRFKHLSTANGLTSDTIYGILPDAAGHLWLSGNSGLMRFDTRTHAIKTYHREHGLQGEEFEYGAAFRTRDGRLCFGGPGAFNIFSPAELTETGTPPRLVLSHLEILGAPVRTPTPYWLMQQVDLDYKANVVSLDFAALDFTSLNRNQLAYRMPGLTDNWISLGTSRRITLTNLEPGDHLLEVRAVNADSVWSANPLRLVLHKSAPPWRSTLAYVFYLLAAVGLGVTLTRAQREKLRDARLTQQRLEAQVALRTQELRETNQQLALASEAKSNFLARMGHELRTPMNGIVGMTELLSRSGLTPAQTRQTQTILGSAQTLLGILNDLLDLSKAEAGKIHLERLPLNLLKLVEECVALFGGAAEAKGLTVVVIPPRCAVPSLLGDPLRIRQVLMNLIGNAVKFTERGEVVVRLELAFENDSRAQVKLSVSDTGIGITDAALARIFEPFSQADETTTRRFGGTGLGLSICRELVELMGGTLEVQSTALVGSTFQVRLPMTMAAPTGAESVRAPLSCPVRIITRHLALADSLENYLSALTTVSIQRSEDLSESQVADGEIWIWDVDAAPLSPTTAVMTDSLLAVGSTRAITELTAAGSAGQFLTKPVNGEALLEALGRAARSVSRTSPKPPDTSVPVEHALHVLVVEDQQINAAVAEGYLTELGCTSVWARDGAAAIARVATERFDLILMDLNMPGLDGCATTKLIRRRKADDSRVPIVALTASDPETCWAACLSAGMDDILSKPYSLDACRDLLLKWSLPRARTTDTSTSSRSNSSLSLIDGDFVRGLRQLGSPEEDLHGKLVGMFEKTSRAVLEQIRRAFEAGDFAAAAAAAHSFKGAAANVGALECSKHIGKVEQALRSNDGALAQRLIKQLESVLPELLNALHSATPQEVA